MYRRVLLCYDGTAEGRKALREGAQVAIAMKAETFLLAICRNTVASTPPEGMTPELVNCQHESAAALLREGVEKLQAHGLTVEGELVIGDPLEQIPAAAKRLSVDLIVVGHRTRGRLARWWADSPQQTLLNLISCSILVSCNSSPGD
jgi:nucleotide-binding universal stress UspA family protein